MGRERRFITVREAADFLSMSESGIRKLIDRSIIPVVRLGRTIRIDGKVLIEQLEVQASEAARRLR